MNALFANRW